MVEFLNHLLSLGVAGFRIGKAAYMWPKDLRAIYDQLNDLPSEVGTEGIRRYSSTRWFLKVFGPGKRPWILNDVYDYGHYSYSGTAYFLLDICSLVQPASYSHYPIPAFPPPILPPCLSR